ncbi:hypothetical protein COCSADRAFT_160299 [Bipolaris sorokiniana ND90Pr]|uniref:Uncharacterized protein n=1 Tax=Cochliobolus sativus (strain ND90Pr / ATCC 201652) TaxID=665912 RepID=M2T4Z0_COCSN|nr:uncharacterized protein COCSADRAFT_160299 [Bipolaris sorokiniana ND90Pr]EMD64052.1 hypothetical protein COCSADRAFT_160299 [Bipolaris sorokiniana ND90Pr]
MQRSTRSGAPKELDLEWVARELVPFLEWAFGENYGRPQRSKAYWVEKVIFAKSRIENVPYYIDFPSTIDTLRLYLVNKAHLTPKEMLEFSGVVVQGEMLCIRIFVRHAMRHSTYDLHSLGTHQSPHFQRPLTAPMPRHPNIKLPESEYAAVMDELQKQLNNNFCNSTGREEINREGAIYRYRSDLSHVRYSNDGSDSSTEQSSNPSEMQSEPIIPSRYALGSRSESHISSATPQDWQHHPSRLQHEYLQPYGPYPGPDGIHGPSVPATTHTSIPQYHQQSPPYTQSQNLHPPRSTYWYYNSSWTHHTMPYHPSQTNSFLPEMANPYATQPPLAAIANQPMRHDFMPGQEKATLPHTAADAYVPRPEAKEFIPEAARRSGLL